MGRKYESNLIYHIKGEYGLRVLANRMLKGIFRHKRKVVTGIYRKKSDEELRNITSRTSQHSMEPEGSIPCSQELSTGPYSELYQSNPYHLILSI
jgi:hypothetical protein